MIRSIFAGIALSSLAAFLLSCTPVMTDTACGVFEPLYYDPTTDRPELVTWARRHNAAWVSLCEKKKL